MVYFFFFCIFVPFALSSNLLQQALELTNVAHIAAKELISLPFATNQAPKDDLSTPRENATFVTLCRNFELYDLMETIQQVQDRFNDDHDYDWVFLNDEPFTDEFVTTVSSLVSGNCSFGLVPVEHWSYPSFIDQERAAETRKRMEEEDIIYGGSESYRHMCRFQSGFFYRHELLLPYKYYWRIEPGVKYHCDIKDDPFREMRVNNRKYGFTLSMFEYEKTIPSLWKEVRSFMEQNPELINSSPDNLQEFVMNDDGSYNLCHFWSNFEIADMDFFRSEHYQRFFNHLDRAGGFFYERWGDAPIHSIAVSLFLNKTEVHWFGDMGYYHAPYLQCPLENNRRFRNRCSCDPGYDFSMNFISCLPHWLHLNGKELPY